MAITVYVIEYDNLIGIVNDPSYLEEKEFETREEAKKFMIHKCDELVNYLDYDFVICNIVLGSDSIIFKMVDEEFDRPIECGITIREEVRYELEF